MSRSLVDGNRPSGQNCAHGWPHAAKRTAGVEFGRHHARRCVRGHDDRRRGEVIEEAQCRLGKLPQLLFLGPTCGHGARSGRWSTTVSRGACYRHRGSRVPAGVERRGAADHAQRGCDGLADWGSLAGKRRGLNVRSAARARRTGTAPRRRRRAVRGPGCGPWCRSGYRPAGTSSVRPVPPASRWGRARRRARGTHGRSTRSAPGHRVRPNRY